jgi:hypothetical protein
MAAYDPAQVRAAQVMPRFSVLARTGVDVATLGTWDADLLHEPRVLVPVDVQAYVVPAAGAEPALALPGPLSPGHGTDPAVVDGPPPFTPGTPRPAGVHLSWAMPDALQRGRLQDPRQGSGGGLGMGALPDRWAVLRVLAAAAPAAGTPPTAISGWLLDAAAGAARDLATGADGAPLPQDPARPLTTDELTGTAGGSLTWTGSYDAAYSRFAWHDPLDDLAADPQLGGTLPGGAFGGTATYVVVGWYSTAPLDPLDGVRTTDSLAERLAGLGWRLITGGGDEGADREGTLGRLADLGVTVASRLDTAATVTLIAPGPADQPARAGRITAADGPGPAAAAAGAAHVSTVPAYQAIGAASLAREAAGWITGTGTGVEASTLLHGAVLGVPLPGIAIARNEFAPDLRPDPAAVGIVAGDHVDDLVAAGLSGVLGGTGDARRSVERLLTAFSSGLLADLSSPDGLVTIDEREHEAGFAGVAAGEPPVTDRVLTSRAPVPPRAAPPQAAPPGAAAPPTLVYSGPGVRMSGFLTEETAGFTRARLAQITVPDASGQAAAARAGTSATPAPGQPAGSGQPGSGAAPAPGTGTAPPDSATVQRQPPGRFVPLDPQIGLRGAGRSPRHGGDGRGDPDELLGCRRGSQIAQRYSGLLDGAALVPALSSGALPDETTALVREALLLSPTLLPWLAARAAPGGAPAPAQEAAPGAAPGGPAPPAAPMARLGAELALRFEPSGGYLGKAAAGLTIGRGDLDPVGSSTLELLRRHSLLDGVEPDLVALTSWAQPWIPAWLEWEVAVTPAADLSGWQLGPVDYEPASPDQAGPGAAADGPAPVTVSGRAHLTTAPGTRLAGAVATWLTAEQARDRDNTGEVDDTTAAQIAALGAAAAGLDLLSVSCDGVRTVLLGLPQTALSARQPDGSVLPPAPGGLPVLLAGGTATLTRLRVVDAFGRLLDLDPAGTVVPERVVVPGAQATMLRTPRITAPTRCRLRLVGAESTDPADAADAVVDEVDASRQVSPVIGFLLPNHVDEGVQAFGSDGTPLGELITEPTGGGVVWEPAPGRPLRADAAPGEGLTTAQRPLGLLASGMVAADAAARAGQPAGAAGGPGESALSAFLRAIDTTLWTVDPISGAGSSAVASIVGRPVAVVRTVLSVDVADDLDALTLDDAGRAARAQAYTGVTRLGVPVRIGELTRTDDGVLGWFADDDYSRMHVVDKLVRDEALAAGPGQGHFGPWGTTPVVPDPQPIDHPYLDTADTVVVHPGSPRLLTVLMLPGSAASVTCGLVPRFSIQLQRAWYAPGLEKLSPSVRVGPVLVDPGQVRLPAVTALGERQVLTHREGPLGWQDDAILAATQEALLPDRASVLREGWIRVDPSPPPPPGTGSGTASTSAGAAS